MQKCEGENDSSSFALSFVSAPWSVSDDECSDIGRPSPSASLWANVATTTPTLALPVKARYGRRERGRDHVRGGGDGKQNAAATANNIPTTDVSPLEGGGRQITQQPLVIDDNNNGVSTRKPQPELYDVWIPHHFFQGKALPTLKRVREGLELQPQPLSGSKTQAVVDNKSGGGAAIAATTPSQGFNSVSGDCHHPVRHQQQHKQLPAAGARCAVHYVSGPEDFVKDDSAPSPPASTKVEAPSAGTTLAQAAYSIKPTVSFAGEDVNNGATGGTAGVAEVFHLEGGHRDVGMMSRKSGRGDDNDDDDRGGTACGLLYDDPHAGPLDSDTTAVNLEGNRSTFGWKDEGEEREQDKEEEEDDEYFDYAKRFSWQTAAEVVKEAEAEAEVRANERRRRRADGNGDTYSLEASGTLMYSRGRQARLPTCSPVHPPL